MTAQTILSIAVTLAGAVTDLRTGKVYNWLTYPAALAGLALAVVAAPPSPLQSAAGLGVGLLLFGTLRRIGRMGAGDVKLMAAVGALQGPAFVLYASFYTVVVAGMAAVLVLAANRRLVPTLRWAASVAASAVVPGVEPKRLEGGQTDMPLAPSIFVAVVYCIYLEAVRGPFSF
jgi:prepilin peptidase CpaA